MNADKLCKLLTEADGVLITSPQNLRYFTGFRGGEGVALITADKRYLFVDSRYTVAAKNEAVGYEVTEYRPGKLCNEIHERQTNISVLAYEDVYMSAAEYHAYKKEWQGIEFKPASGDIDKLRMVKTQEELEYAARAEQIGVDAFLKVLPVIKPGITETDLAAELEYQMRRLGAEGISFETIAISGIKTSMPHGIPDSKKIEYGDFVTMDFGCRHMGYCSDMTRTIVVGKANDEQRKIYSTVLKAQLAGLEAIKSGVICRDADAAARQIIADAGYGRFFGHSLGHGVGLMIHELPNLSPKSETILEPGMIVTCEPGIYIPGFGGVRIEDMVYVTENGNVNMTKLSKELIEI